MNKKETIRPRDKAFSTSLPDYCGGIVFMVEVDSLLEIISHNCIARIVTAEAADPEYKDPDLLHMRKMVSHTEGSRNAVVSRIFIQPAEAIKDAFLIDEFEKNKFMHELACARGYLLACHDIACDLAIDVYNIQCKKYKKDIVVNVDQIEDIERRVGDFFTNIKLYFFRLGNIYNVSFGKKFRGHRFDKIYKDCVSMYGEDDYFSQSILNLEAISKRLGEFRNAKEHPKDDLFLDVENFTIKQNSLIPPRFKLSNEEDWFLAASIFQQIIRDTISSSEEFLILCLFKNIKESFIKFNIVFIPEEKMDADCPVRFKFEVDPASLPSFPKK